jgi:hypothetical protein
MSDEAQEWTVLSVKRIDGSTWPGLSHISEVQGAMAR